MSLGWTETLTSVFFPFFVLVTHLKEMLTGRKGEIWLCKHENTHTHTHTKSCFCHLGRYTFPSPKPCQGSGCISVRLVSSSEHKYNSDTKPISCWLFPVLHNYSWHFLYEQPSSTLWMHSRGVCLKICTIIPTCKQSSPGVRHLTSFSFPTLRQSFMCYTFQCCH